MCRFAAYQGPAVRLSRLIYEAPHSLERQAYRPGEMVSGHVNVDGTGVAWWTPEEAEPLCYVSERPPWSDPNLPRLAPRLLGAPVLAVVRSMTEGMPTGPAATHPFVVDGLAGSHNGFIEGFHEDLGWDLLETLPRELRAEVDLVSDSLLIILAVAAALRDDRDAGLAGAVATTVGSLVGRAQDAGRRASLNVVVASQSEVVAARGATGVEANSLYLLERADDWPGGVLLASEPLDGGPWRSVPTGSLVRLSGGEAEVSTWG